MTSMPTKICPVAGCGRKIHSRGHCRGHSERIRDGHPEPFGPLASPLPPGSTVADALGRYLRQEGDCSVWTSERDKKGYGLIYRPGAPRLRAHRAAWELANGPIPDGLFVLHACDNPPCCNTAHLFLGTKADNNADMYSKGRAALGSRNGHAKLTESNVREIRALLASGLLQREIAERFGVTQTTISPLLRGVTWKHVAADTALAGAKS